MERQSRQRDAILKCLSGTKSHPTVEWIYEQVRRDIPGISLGTVYRNLRKLSAKGRIMELDLGREKSRYDYTAANHYHFRCLDCDRVFDIEEPVNTEIEQRVARSTGFTVTGHQLELRGYCQGCQPEHS